jgi:hypothetical protein
MAFGLKPAMFEALGKVAKASMRHFLSFAESPFHVPDWASVGAKPQHFPFPPLKNTTSALRSKAPNGFSVHNRAHGAPLELPTVKGSVAA